MKTRVAKYHQSVAIDNDPLKQSHVYAHELSDIARYWSGDLGDNKRLANKVKALTARVVIEAESATSVPLMFRWAIVQPRYRDDLSNATTGKTFVDNFFDDPRSGSSAFLGYTEADATGSGNAGASGATLMSRSLDKERYRIFQDQLVTLGPGIASGTDATYTALTGGEGLPPVVVRDDVIKLNTTLHYDRISNAMDDTVQSCLNKIYLVYWCRQTLGVALPAAPTTNIMTVSARVNIKWIDDFGSRSTT